MEKPTLSDLESLLEQMLMGAALVDRDGNVLYANTAFRAMLGMDAKADRIQDPPLVSALKEGRDRDSLKTEFKGKFLMCQVHFSFPGKPGQAVVYAEDVTRYETMALTKGNFVHTLLHQIRNSLTSTKTYLSVLKASPEIHGNEPALEILDMTLGETNRLVALHKDLGDTVDVENDPAKKPPIPRTPKDAGGPASGAL